MRILVTGATGFVGSKLCELLKQRGDNVVALSRDAAAAKKNLPLLHEAHAWEPVSSPAPLAAFEQVDAVVNLLGENVAGRWTKAKRAAIRDSRVIGTRNLVKTMERLESKPKVLISSSAIGYYGDRGEEELTEESPAGNDFLARTSREWESAAAAAEPLGVRVVRLRTSIVLGPGGAMEAMLLPFKLGLGGPLGSGKQWWAWIHREDLARLILHLLDSDFSGAVNAAAPNPVRQKEFAKVLGRVLHRPAFMPAPAFAMKIVLGGFASELLSSKKILPRAAEQMGFEFEHPELEPALRQVVGR